jgi:hypothetical protein
MHKEEMKDDEEKIVGQSRKELAEIEKLPENSFEPSRREFRGRLDNVTQISLGK